MGGGGGGGGYMHKSIHFVFHFYIEKNALYVPFLNIKS